MKKIAGSIELAVVIALGALIAFGLVSYKIYHAGYAAAERECKDAAEKQRAAEAKKGAAASDKKEKQDAKAKVVYRTITKTVDKYIDRPVYRNVCFDVDGLRDANAALSGALTPAGKPDKRVPKPDAPR